MANLKAEAISLAEIFTELGTTVFYGILAVSYLFFLYRVNKILDLS